MAGVCLAGLLTLTVAGCAQNAERDKKDTIKIGVAIYRGDDAFISSVSSSTGRSSSISLTPKTAREVRTIRWTILSVRGMMSSV